jgi:hypothetical protein
VPEVISREAFERAVRYPYAIPSTHFRFDPAADDILAARHARLLRAEVAGRDGDTIFYNLDLDLDGTRHRLPAVCPVVAAGSNAAPQQLRRKFRGIVDDPVYAIRCRLSGWIPAYSAHFSRYGAIAACLQQWPGANSHLFVTLLTPAGLARMHDTETLGTHYRFASLAGAPCHLGEAPLELALYYYDCLHGPLRDTAGAPIPLAAFDVRGCPAQCFEEEQVLRAAMQDLFPDCTLDMALARILASDAARLHATGLLKSLRIAPGASSAGAPMRPSGEVAAGSQPDYAFDTDI